MRQPFPLENYTHTQSQQYRCAATYPGAAAGCGRRRGGYCRRRSRGCCAGFYLRRVGCRRCLRALDGVRLCAQPEVVGRPIRRDEVRLFGDSEVGAQLRLPRGQRPVRLGHKDDRLWRHLVGDVGCVRADVGLAQEGLVAHVADAARAGE